jgi:uncharacterized repeat protein (TIGR01451 family)
MSSASEPAPAGTTSAAKSPARSPRWNHLRRRGALAVLAVLAGTLALAAGPAAAAGPAWHLTVTPGGDYFVPDAPGAPDENATYTIEAENVGTETVPATKKVTLEDTAPAGTSANAVKFYASPLGIESERHATYCATPSRCEFTGAALEPGDRLVMIVRVDVPEGAAGALLDSARVSGGGAPAATASAANAVSAEPPWGPLGFRAATVDSSKTPYTQAAGHPFQLTTEFNFPTYAEPTSEQVQGGYWGQFGLDPTRDPRDIGVELPAGLVGNPQGVPRCSLAEFFAAECGISTVVGVVAVRLFDQAQGGSKVIAPLFNLQPAGQYPGELGFKVAFPFLLTAGLRSGSDYGLDVTSMGSPVAGLSRVRVTTWGVPAASEHDPMRGKTCLGGIAWEHKFVQSVSQNEAECEASEGDGGNLHGGPAGVPPTPFLTMPSDCSGSPLTIGAKVNSWEEPENYALANEETPAVDGCNQLKFEPTIEARPTTSLADAPSGFDFNLTVPQNINPLTGKEDPEGLATADLKEAVVKLPPGLVVNPSSGAGLEGCSPTQIGLKTPVATTPAHFTESPEACPDASKLGSVEVNTQLLHNPLQGSVYLATPHQNPSGNLLAGYIVLEGEGIIVKLAGQFHADPVTGQITAGFLENPQLPFEEFKFHFFEGARGALRTPAVCGSYETTSELTPWSHMEGEEEATPIAHPSAEFETTVGAGGGSCPNAASEEPNAPVFHAGTESPQAGIYSPFSLKLVRQDGSQELKGIDTTLPPGLVGKLAGIAECSDAQLAAAAGKSGQTEQASPSCPLSSEVGTVDVASGAGPTPLNVSGKAYLAGPYKSAPLSLAIITPAVAGPFDLGTVLVRTALYVNPETAQIHAVSDPIPTILEGIPLDVRSITLKMARPNFTLNPTNCEPLSFTGSALSVLNVSAPLTQRFQVGGCPALAFKPKLKLSLKGSTKRAGHPALKAVLTMPPGSANVAKAQVTLPHSEFLDQGHIGTVCTRVQFAEGSTPGEKCPPASIYGFARATTPLLDKPVEGPVYLRSSSHKLPDLVAALNGQIQVALAGKVDTGKNGGIRNSFEVVPDAPVSKFTLSMQGGRKGLLENSENLCSPKAKTKAIADFTAQNGKLSDTEPAVKVKCSRARKGRHHGHHKRHRPSRAG